VPSNYSRGEVFPSVKNKHIIAVCLAALTVTIGYVAPDDFLLAPKEPGNLGKDPDHRPMGRLLFSCAYLQGVRAMGGMHRERLPSGIDRGWRPVATCRHEKVPGTIERC